MYYDFDDVYNNDEDDDDDDDDDDDNYNDVDVKVDDGVMIICFRFDTEAHIKALHS